MSPLEGLSTAAAPEYLVTHDTARTDHIITDDQLMRLAAGGRDKSFDIALAAIGAASGFSQNFYTAYVAVRDSKPIDGWAFVGSVVFVIAVTTAIICLIAHCLNRTDIDSLLTKIKTRKASRMPPGASDGEVIS